MMCAARKFLDTMKKKLSKEKEKKKPRHVLRDIPWWRRVTGLLKCPIYGGTNMKLVSKGKAWACLSCGTVLVHKEGGKKYGSS